MAKKPVVAHKTFSTITYGDVKASPSGWLDAAPKEALPMEDFETALSTLVDSYRNIRNKHEVSRILAGTAEIVEKDEGWIYDEVNVQPVSPTLTSLTPNTAVVGGADLTLTRQGPISASDSVIVFDGEEEEPTSSRIPRLTCVIEPSLASEGAVPVLVKTSSMQSASVDFTFTAPV